MPKGPISRRPGVRWLQVACLVAVVAATGAGRCDEAPAGDSLSIALRTQDDKTCIAVAGLPPDALARLESQADLARSVMKVYVGPDASEDQPAMLGTYRVADHTLVFDPRFPLQPGVSYRVVLSNWAGNDSAAELSADGRSALEQIVSVPRQEHPPTRIEAVYPSAEVLPENQLKFYVHFSAPMTQGDSYRHVRLLDESGEEIEVPFVHVGSELWDRSGRRITLLLDPGRIKRGLRPREELGPILRQGNTYRLMIDASWHDAAGSPLVEPYEKVFRVTEPDDQQPDPRRWRIEPPQAGSRRPLVIHFQEPLDHALLQHALRILDTQGNAVPGQINVTDSEQQWSLTPDHPWRAGNYRLEVDTTLEDLAGNSIGRPFEVDIFEQIDQTVERTTVSVDFRIEDTEPSAQASPAS